MLVDTDTGEVYLGELNPRISGASSITNVTAGAYADVPLFLFHMLEYMDVDFELDVDEINERWEELASVDVWSQMVMKETDDIVQQLTATPRTGQYSLDDERRADVPPGRAGLAPAAERDRRRSSCGSTVPATTAGRGADLGVLVTKGRLQVDSGRRASRRLAIRARHLIDSIRAGIRRYADRRTRSPGHECRGQVGLSFEVGEREPLQSSPWCSEATPGACRRT